LRGGTSKFGIIAWRGWGVKDGKELAKLLPNFRHIEDHSLVEGMAEFIPIFKLLKKIKPVSNISNKIVVMEK
jgi:hypothetical protein